MNDLNETHTNGAKLLKALFQMMEEDGLNIKLSRLLKDTVEKTETNDKQCQLTFHNGIILTIFFNLEDFFILLSDPTLYQNEDKDNSRVSIDRIMMYLKLIATRGKSE